MAAKGIGALVVMEGEQVVGIVTGRDYARRTEVEARTGRDALVRDIMTRRSSAYVPTTPARTASC
jgi:CBS domain-containing protein